MVGYIQYYSSYYKKIRIIFDLKRIFQQYKMKYNKCWKKLGGVLLSHNNIIALACETSVGATGYFNY